MSQLVPTAVNGQVLAPIEVLISVTDDVGGYKNIKCLLCKNSDWDGRLVHDEGCPLENVKSLAQAQEATGCEF